jgi:hypothetical protein
MKKKPQLIPQLNFFAETRHTKSEAIRKEGQPYVARYTILTT